MSLYTVLERLYKLEKHNKETNQFYVDVEAGVETMSKVKEKIEAEMIKFESDIKDRMTKLESDISEIKKALGLGQNMLKRKNKIKIPKNMTNRQIGNIDWIINILAKSNDTAISSVNTFFKDFDVKYRYKIKIKVKSGK